MFDHEVRAVVHEILKTFRSVEMATLQELKDRLSDLETSVGDLLQIPAAPSAPAGVAEADLDPIVAGIDDLKAKVDAAVAQHTAPTASYT